MWTGLNQPLPGGPKPWEMGKLSLMLGSSKPGVDSKWMAFSEKLNYRSITILGQPVSLDGQMWNDLFPDENPVNGKGLLFTRVCSTGEEGGFLVSLVRFLCLSTAFFVTRNLFKSLFISFPYASRFLKDTHVIGRKTSMREKEVWWIQTKEWIKIQMIISFIYTEKEFC